VRRIIANIIGTLCICSAVLAQYPTVTATVTTTSDAVTYSYRLINTTPDAIWQFAIFMPMGAADTIASYNTSRVGWYTMIREAAFDMINWDWHGTTVIEPGHSADFSFTTPVGIPTTNSFTTPGSDSNWGWAYGIPDGGTGGQGNTILPVPVPEPSSLLALGAGALGLLGLRLRRPRINH